MKHDPEMHATMYHRGDLIEVDGVLAAVVALAGEPYPFPHDAKTVPDDHLALWFGYPATKPISRGGTGGHAPVIHTVPIESCRLVSTVIAWYEP